MSTEGLQAPPSRALLALAPIDTNWQPILSVSNQVVLYNPTSHALSIKKSSQQAAGRARPRACLYCKQPLPPDFEYDSDTDVEIDSPLEEIDPESNSSARVPNYFQLLEIANETSSRPSSPHPQTRTNDDQNRAKGGGGGAFAAEAMASGYFKAFFQEECRLGMGAYGSVFLCQVRQWRWLHHIMDTYILVNEAYARWEPSWALCSEEDRSGGVSHIFIANTT